MSISSLKSLSESGRIVMCLLEKLSPKFLRYHLPAAVAGWVIIIGLMVYTTALDIKKYASGILS